MRTVVERRVTYKYGPQGAEWFVGVFAGPYTWEQLEERIKEDRWGGSYVITKREERKVRYTEWRDER